MEKSDKTYFKNNFPPANSYLAVDELKSYPIEINRVPFGIIDYVNNKQKEFCSNHGVQQLWNKIKGMITYKEFINSGGKIINTNERDHLYATSKY